MTNTIPFDNRKQSLSISEQSFLCETLCDPMTGIDITFDQLWEMSKQLTYARYKYLLALYYNHKYDELEQALKDLIK